MAIRTRILLILIVMLLSMGLSMGWGMLAQRNHWPPWQVAKTLLDAMSPPPGGGQNRPDPALVEQIDPFDRETDPRGLIHANSPAELDELRSQMTAFLFGEDRLPVALPRLVAENVDHPDLGPGVSIWEIEMEFGIRSLVLEIASEDPDAPVVIYHQGHLEPVSHHAPFLREMAARGARVFALAVILGARNPGSVVDLPVGHVRLSHHGHLAWLQPQAGHAMRFLVEPVIVLLNEIQARDIQAPVTMIGLSGGGWTTVLASALDARVQTSVSVAGGLPMWLRFGRRTDWGCWEEHRPEFYSRFSYLDMYTMGASPRGRIQLHVLNQFDPSSYAGLRSQLYEQAVQERLDSFGAGEFRVMIDDTHAEHAVSAAAQVILMGLIGLDAPAQRN